MYRKAVGCTLMISEPRTRLSYVLPLSGWTAINELKASHTSENVLIKLGFVISTLLD